jgi:hypothetical protein
MYTMENLQCENKIWHIIIFKFLTEVLRVWANIYCNL